MIIALTVLAILMFFLAFYSTLTVVAHQSVFTSKDIFWHHLASILFILYAIFFLLFALLWKLW